MARILLVGVDPVFQGKLEALLAGHRVVSHDGIDPPDLVIADVGRVDAAEVADNYPEVPLLGFANSTDAAGVRLARAAGFDEVVAKPMLFERSAELIGGLLATIE
jgi:hypothetical protein